MEIKFNADISPVPNRRGAVRAQAGTNPGQEISFSQSTALDDALAALSDVRPEVVERAQGLVGHVNYPPLEVMQRIARLLAVSIEETE